LLSITRRNHHPLWVLLGVIFRKRPCDRVGFPYPVAR